MIKYFFILLISFLFLINCAPMQKNDRTPNRLINESSPYLLQHAYNPVDWYPWGTEALEKAKLENKMILVSIGYAACHWCHVMEHESFEDSIVASIMNENFICIKVDREERPDIDNVYMTACQLTTGSGCGWPLNAFTLPDGRPVWAGTYFPKEKWMNILHQFQEVKQANPEKLEDAAEKITEGIANYGALEVVEEEKVYNQEELSSIATRFLESLDLINGGRKGAPKFPMPNNYEFLLRYAEQYKHRGAKEATILTLDKMADGGIYDQIGGGFARYSVDLNWKVPHFEKMLYDNGQLLGLYAEAYKLTGKQRFLQIIEETVNFASNDLMNESGGFYSSYDADSEGEEGVFYIWKKEELIEILGDDAEIISDYYSVTDEGNWEGFNILHITKSKNEIVERHNLDNEEALDVIVESAKEKLKKYRSNRIFPGLDDKVLASWNGLMLSGLSKGYAATKNKKHLDLAIKNATFLRDEMMKEDGRIHRNYKNGKSTINGFLDDYGNVVAGFINLYQVTFNKQWLDDAMKIMIYAKENFWDETDQMYSYKNQSDVPLIAKTRNYSDNVIPSGNSVMARNLFHLGILYSDDSLVNQARQMLTNVAPLFVQTEQPSFYSNWLQLYLDFVERPYEVAIVGDDAQEILEELQSNFLPNALFMGGAIENLPLLQYKLQEGETNIYVCKNKVCKFPVKTVDAALKLLR